MALSIRAPETGGWYAAGHGRWGDPSGSTALQERLAPERARPQENAEELAEEVMAIGRRCFCAAGPGRPLG